VLASKGAAVAFQPQIRLRDLIAPLLLTVAAILLTSVADKRGSCPSDSPPHLA
jgi:hypothetical protein